MRVVASRMLLREALAKITDKKEIRLFDNHNNFIRFNSLVESQVKPKLLNEVVEFRVTPTKYDIKFVDVCYADGEKRS